MSAAKTAETSSRSRGRQDANPEPEPPQRSWVALVSNPVLLVRKGNGARPKSIRRGEDIRLDLHDPPLASYLEMLYRPTAPVPPVGYFAQEQPQASAYILAADRSGRLLVQVTGDPDTNRSSGPDLFLCDAYGRTASRMQAIPFATLPVTAQPGHSIALIGNPLLRGEYLIAQLHPRTSSVLVADRDRLLCYNTASLQCSVKTLHLDASFPDRMRKPCAEATVLGHDKRLWWLALAYGVFICDPFTPRPCLRFIPLPAGCEMREELSHRVLVDQRRCVAPSEGQLRYVEVRGLSYEVEAHGDAAPRPDPENPPVWMWTLVDPKPQAAEPWRFEYEVPFAEVWAHDSYAAAGLPHGVVPHVALVDPTDHGIVYFLQGSKLFGLDVRARRVVSREECLPEHHRQREMMLRTSRPLIDAWELLPRRQEDEEDGSPKHIVKESHANPYPGRLPRNAEAVEELQGSSSTSQAPKSADIARRNIQLKLRQESHPATIAKLAREECFVNRYDDEY